MPDAIWPAAPAEPFHDALPAPHVLPAVDPIHRAARRAAGHEWLGISYDRLLDGHLLALCVTPAMTDDRAEFGRLIEAVQQETGESVEVTFVDPSYNEIFVSAHSEAKNRFRAAR